MIILLIVPYGIETEIRRTRLESEKLLIVPYGIETTDESSFTNAYKLLIVPYGIETVAFAFSRRKVRTFNRTLWN